MSWCFVGNAGFIFFTLLVSGWIGGIVATIGYLVLAFDCLTIYFGIVNSFFLNSFIANHLCLITWNLIFYLINTHYWCWSAGMILTPWVIYVVLNSISTISLSLLLFHSQIKLKYYFHMFQRIYRQPFQSY